MAKRFAVLCGLSLGLMALGASAATLTISSNTTWNDGTPAAEYDSVTIADGVTLTFEIASGTCTYSGPTITGAGAVKKTGGGTLVFSGNNTFDGDLTVEAGTFQANSAGAFGSTKGKTICKRSNTSGPLLIFGATMETDEEFDLKSTNDSGRSPQFAAGTVVTLNGSLNLNSALNNWDIPANTAVIVNGNVSNGGTWGYGASPTTSMIYWNGDFVQTTTWYFNGGCHYLKGHFTTSGNASFNTRNGNYHFQGENVLNGTQVVHQEDANNLKYYLEGYDQTCSKMGFSHANDESWNSFVINSTSGNTWHVKSGDSAIAAQFTGNVGLSCEGGTQYILKESTSTGTLTVKGGAVVEMLTVGSAPYPKNTKTASWAGDVTVEAGSTLKVNASTSVSSSAKVSVSGEGATLQLNADLVLGGTGELWLDGARAESGVWGAIDSGAEHESAHISGTGTITVPVRPLEITADMLVGGVYTVASAAEYSGIKVSAPATIRGATLTVLDLGTVTVGANATFECPLVFGKAANESVAISVASGVEARFSGAISGPADITSGGAGTVYFAGANTFTGKLTVEAGKFHAASDGAFGATDGKTVCDTGAAGAPELFFDGITTAEPLRLASGNSKIHFIGENTFNADIELTKSSNGNQQHWDFQKGSKTVFNGALKDVDNCALFMGFVKNETPWGEIFFNGGVTIQNVWYFQRGIIHYGGTISAVKFRARGPMTAYLECEQLSNVDIAQEDQAGNLSYVLDACDSSITGIARGSANNGGEATRGNKMMSFTSKNGRTLHVTGADKTDSLFYGTFTGDVGASFEGSGSAIVLGGANTSTGTLTAKNGHVVRFAPSSTYTGLADTGSWAGEISVEAGSTVELNSAANLTQTTRIRVAGENAKLQLNSNVVLGGEGELWLGGEKATSGEWGSVGSGAAHTSEYLSGTGRITVPAQPLVITEDTLEDGVYNVATPKECSSIIVSAPATIRGAALTIAGLDGLIVNANATFECPLVIGKAANAQIQINVATNVELHVTGVVSGPSDIITAGEGSIFFSGANTFDGNLTIGGKVIFYADSDAAFGSAAGWTKCDTDTGAILRFRGADGLGIATAEPFILHDNRKGRIWFDGLTNVLSGSITLTGSGFNWWQFPKASTTSFNCPVTNATGATAGFWGNGYLEGVENQIPPFAKIHWNGPVKCAEQFYFELGDHYVDGNLGGSFAGLRQFNPRGANFFYSGPDALGPNVYFQPESRQALVHNFEGCDQTIGFFNYKNEAGHDQPSYYITSKDGRTLNVVDTVNDQTCLAICMDSISLNFVGSKNVDILRASTSTGMLSVVSGATAKFSSTKKASRVDFTGLTGSWAGDVTVGSGSKLTLAADAFTGRKGTLFLEGNAIIDIPAGLEVRVGYLRINGELQPRGYYGSTVSGLDPAVKAHFTGEGVLRAAHGNQGAVLIVR